MMQQQKDFVMKCSDARYQICRDPRVLVIMTNQTIHWIKFTSDTHIFLMLVHEPFMFTAELRLFYKNSRRIYEEEHKKIVETEIVVRRPVLFSSWTKRISC